MEKEIEEKNKPESSLPDFKGLINYQEPINYVIFGCEYEINYYYKDDIEKLLKIMLKESTEATKTKNEDLKKETQRINNINRNKKEL